jgi:hypothetical protein
LRYLPPLEIEVPAETTERILQWHPGNTSWWLFDFERSTNNAYFGITFMIILAAEFSLFNFFGGGIVTSALEEEVDDGMIVCI